MKKMKIDFLYNMIYQMLVLLVPLITTPYLSRILGVTGIGIYSYTYSIVYYFMIFALLGINNYGSRIIAKNKDDIIKTSKEFFSLYSLQFILGICSIFLYLIYVFFFCKEYRFISILQIIYLFSNLLDINWFFYGTEKFKITVTRNIVIKIISVFLIFTFVKGPSDIWIYTIIMSLSSFMSQLVLFPFLRKTIKFVKISYKDILKHLKPCIILFLPVIAISVYKYMDKIMLGMMSSIEEVGLYEQAEKIINIPMGIITAMSTVMLPFFSKNSSTNNKKQQIEESFNLIMFISFPIAFGILCVSGEFIPLFLGDAFHNSIYLVNILVITIIFISFATVIRAGYLLPKEKDKIYALSVLSGAVVNLILNLILIPKYNAIGASVATVFAEFSVMILQIIATHKYLDYKKYFINILPFFVKSSIMFLLIYLIKYLNVSDILTIALQVLLGVVIYFVLNLQYIKNKVLKG